jgi:U4/U6 small nuclear ribonucleoprotein PRP4
VPRAARSRVPVTPLTPRASGCNPALPQLRRRARALAVPTDDRAVRAALRERGEPITLFGEREMERRERLRALLAALDQQDGGELPAPADAEMLAEAPAEPELFYTEGSAELLVARAAVADFSLPRTAARLAAERARADAGLPPMACAAAHTAAATVASLACECSHFGDERPLAACALSPDGTRLLTGGWSGLVQLWSELPRRCERVRTVRAHDERISGVAWHPAAGGDGGAGGAADAVAFATAACDKTARLWSAQGACPGCGARWCSARLCTSRLSGAVMMENRLILA